MNRTQKRWAVSALVVLAPSAVALSADRLSLTEEQTTAAAANYQQYCALCHGKDREGYANDHAPSLRSKSLMTSGSSEMIYATAYGRLGTPMAGYLDDIGGPMTLREVVYLIRWLQSQVDTESYARTFDAIVGDVEVGKRVYAEDCASCHGENGEGGTGTALGNSAMLSLSSDAFLKYAIVNGRDGTKMPAFGEVLLEEEINGVTAFLRSRSTGWTVEKPVIRKPPQVGDYILNPESPPAEFELKDDVYVMSADLLKAMQEKRRMVLLDTRAMSQWQMVNLEGSVPLPYYTQYEGIEALAKELPDDDTIIVTYCECPRAAAEHVNAKLREQGLSNTAVLWEGIRGWVALGYPVFRGETNGMADMASQEAAQSAE